MRITVRRFWLSGLVLAVGALSAAKPADDPGSRAKRSRARVDPQLVELAHTPAARGRAGADTWPLLVRDDGIVIHAAATGDARALLAELAALGLRHGAAVGNFVSGVLPREAIAALEALPDLALARPAMATTSREVVARSRGAHAPGSVVGQGVVAMRVDEIRPPAAGAGTRVGVVADSFDCLGGMARDTRSGDLPRGVVLIDDSFTAGCVDEGRALAQVIHDIAPRSEIGFHTGFNGQPDTAEGIRELARDFAADVIVDDVLYFDEPFFQDGVVSRAVDEVHDQGVVFVSAVGNAGHRSYDAPFRDSGQTGYYQYLGETRRHDFDPGPGVDVFQTLTLPPFASTVLILQWDEPFLSASTANPPVGAATDYDLMIYRSETPTSGNNADVLVRSDFFNPGRDAFEALRITNPGATPLAVYVAIERFRPPGFDGPDVDRMKLIDVGSLPEREWNTGDGATSFGHANARGAIAVGAAAWFETPRFGVSPPLAETYSSAGGVPIVFDTAGQRLAAPIVRETPDLIAPDGVNTSFYEAPGDIPEDDDAFPNFFGSSAAAPHVAGVAALLQGRAQRGRGVALTPDAIEQLLEAGAVDMAAPGYDLDTGHGLIDARAAFDSLTGIRPR